MENEPMPERVLVAIAKLDQKLDAAQAQLKRDAAERETAQVKREDDLREETKRRQHWLFGGIAVYVTIALLAFGAYLRNDALADCRGRSARNVAVREALHTDHAALPKALHDGFGDSEDVAKVVAVIRNGYAKSEAQLAAKFPAEDCGTFFGV